MPRPALRFRSIANEFLICELSGVRLELGPGRLKRLAGAVELNEKGTPHLAQFVTDAAPESIRLLHCEPAFYPGKGIAQFASRLKRRGDGLAIGLREPSLPGQ